MKFTLSQTILLGACLLAGCEDPKEEARPKQDLGLKVIPAGENPARDPVESRPKGVMINMDSQEVRILVVPPASEASKSGFRAGDVIVAAGGKEISNEDQLAAAISTASGKKIFFEVRRNRKLLTLSLASRDPGWIALSGDAFRGFLLTRAQTKRKIPDLPVGKKIPALKLPTFQGPAFSLSPKNPRPLALLFWGTFLPPCYDHLRAFAQACKDRQVFCLAIDTMELFTAVGKTKEFQAELEKVKQELWPEGPIPIDLFLESERKFGVKKLPTLLLADPQGKITARFDGGFKDPQTEIPAALDDLLSD